MNNFEKIKSMTIDEMALLLCDDCHCCAYYDDGDCLKLSHCLEGVKQWLESEEE